MPLTLLLLLALFFGATAGLRTMSAPALICWGCRLHWLNLDHSPLSFLATTVSLVVFTLLAIGELIGDKLPKTPSRLAAFPLIARVISGALAGTALGITAGAPLLLTAGAPLLLAPGAGAVGALIGAFAGYHLRRALTTRAGLPDLPVALLEDLIAFGGGVFIVSRF